MIDRRSGLNGRRVTDEGCPYLSEDDVNVIAERIVVILRQRVYQEVGKSMLRKLFWTATAAILSIGYWLNSKGWL